MIEQFNWSLVQAFLVVAETGSLSAAARQLKASQPTLGRQIKQMEDQLRAELFLRKPRGLVLTETGAALIAPARAMRDAMNAIALTVAGQEESLQGTVRVTASTVTAFYHMPKIIADIRKAEPNIEIELVPSDDTRNLLFREADIAVRMYRPTQLDLITQFLGDIPVGVFAAKSYLTERGYPTPENMLEHEFVGYDKNPIILDGLRSAGLDVDRHFFGARCDDYLTYWEMVAEGCGIGFAQALVGRSETRVDEIDFGFPMPKLPVWLTAHEAMRQTPRIRRVWDLLAQGLKPLVT